MAAEAATFFHRTGVSLDAAAVGPVDGGALRPALFAHFHDLARLRYDFPLVLAEDVAGNGCIETLSGRIDGLLVAAAPSGVAGDRVRRLVLRIEREIRAAVAAGGDGPLEEAWDAATERVAAGAGDSVAAELAQAQAALALAERLVDCRAGTAALVVEHAWRAIRDRRTRERRATIDALARRLSGLVAADFVRSAPGRSAALLRASVGDLDRDLFDFDAMAHLLAAPSGPSAVSSARRRRIEDAVEVLRGQRFYGGAGGYEFDFDSLDAAQEAYRERLPEMARLVRALTIADLELQGAYVEAEHDTWFRDFGPAGLRPEDQALFPDYLVRLDGAAVDTAGTSLLGALAGDAPLKVVVSVDDPFGLGGQLAESAMGLGDVFVLQATASQLYGVRDRMQAALEYRGPALLSIFTGDVRPDLPPYLVAAAARESRVFPSFSDDPSAGPDFAQRFALHDNPQAERPWTVHDLAWADEALQRVTAEVAFTPADYAVCDPRQSAHLARVPRERWNDSLVPIDGWLADGADGSSGRVPVVVALDQDGGLQKLVVDERLARATRRRAEAWHRLRELDALKEERVAAAAPPVAPEAAAPEAPAAEAPLAESASAEAPTAAPAAALAAALAPQHSRDDAYIETPRCTTCNECTGVNARMFAYDANGQAYVADPAAGTYRELVEAAERCQVAIIHPGKPRNPGEPGLDDLLARAEPFR